MPRQSGIAFLGDVSWGTHFCVFYETKRDLLDAAVAYFKAGLEGNEFCVWAISDPVAMEDATTALRDGVPGFAEHHAAGRIELLPGYKWYLKGDAFDLKRITGGWDAKLRAALLKGYQGMRVSGNAFWLETNLWKEFIAYELELDTTLAGKKMIALCTYPLQASRALDILDVAHAHQFTLARRNGAWEFMETPELRQAKRLIRQLNQAFDILSKPFPGHRLLTQRERLVLAQMVKGSSSKDIAPSLGISSRTVEFHRSNILKKLGVKSTTELMRVVLAE